MRALIVRHDRLGDLILTTPLVRALSEAGYKVDIVAKRAFIEIFANSPHVANAFALEEVAGPHFPRKWLPLGRWIRRRKYEVSIITPGLPKEVLFASLLGGARKRVALYGGKWARFTLHRVVPSSILGAENIHYSDKLLASLQSLGIPAAGNLPEIHLLDEEKAWARRELAARFGPQGITIVVHPGSGGVAYGAAPSTCNLPMAEYERFCRDVLAQTDWNIALTGSQPERVLIEKWDPQFLQNPRVWLTAGQLNIRQVAALIGAARLVIVTGSAPLHIASAMRTATVSPFCPGFGISASCWGNLGGAATVVEPASCPRLSDPTQLCGDFEGKITGRSLFERAVAAVKAG